MGQRDGSGVQCDLAATRSAETEEQVTEAGGRFHFQTMEPFSNSALGGVAGADDLRSQQLRGVGRVLGAGGSGRRNSSGELYRERDGGFRRGGASCAGEAGGELGSRELR